jgi:hypothetical protein
MDNAAGLASGANFEGVIKIEEEKIRSHVDQVVRETVEQTLDGLLQAEADELCGAKRYARSSEWLDLGLTQLADDLFRLKMLLGHPEIPLCQILTRLEF